MQLLPSPGNNCLEKDILCKRVSRDPIDNLLHFGELGRLARGVGKGGRAKGAGSQTLQLLLTDKQQWAGLGEVVDSFIFQL